MEWTPVRIPTPLFEEVTDVIATQPHQGYTNEHEFIRDAVREKILDVKTKEKNPTKEV